MLKPFLELLLELSEYGNRHGPTRGLHSTPRERLAATFQVPAGLAERSVSDGPEIDRPAALTFRDRTEEGRAEDALPETDARYRAIVEQAAVGIALVETDTGQVLEANARFSAMLGLTREELQTQTWKAVTHPEDRAPNDESMQRMKSSGAAFQVEKRYLHKNGSTVWARVTVSPVTGTHGQVRRHIVSVEDITEKKRADAELREKDLQLRHALEAAGAGVWFWDLATNRNTWSDEVWSLYGLDPGQCDPSYAVWRESIFPPDRASVEAALRAAVAGARDINLEWRVASRPDRWVLSRGQPQMDSAGALIAYRGIVVDISDRKLSESALRESEARYRSLFANMKNGFAYCRMLYEDGRPWDFVYLSVNRAFESLTGLTGVEGKRVSEVIPGFRDSAADLLERYARVAREGNSDRFEYHLKPIDTWFELSVYSTEPDHFVALFDVITARKHAEAERERLMAAIEQAGELVIVTAPDGTIQYVNPAFEVITGYSRAEAVGKNPRMLKSGKHDAAFYAGLWGAIRSGRVWRGQFVNRRKNGSFYTEDATVSPVTDAQGNVVNIVAVGRDISEHLRIEEQLRASQKIEAIGHLAGGVAHDFNNLLSAILSYAELILEGVREVDPMRQDVLEIIKAGERGATLTRQLLAFSRKQVLEPKVIDLNQVVSGIQKMLQRLIGEDIDLVLSLSPSLRPVKADPGQIEQVVMNLVVNARDAMPTGGKITIETANVDLDADYLADHLDASGGPQVRLAVSDNGIGMDLWVKDRVFEPFFTTKERGKGTGLGLSTVYGIVKQSGGNIEVLSEPDVGTTFNIFLPQVSLEVDPTSLRARSERLPAGTETILLVEDDDAVRQVTGRMLRAVGYAVIEAANGMAALAACERQTAPIDLLLTDVVMPNMSGPALVERLRAVRPMTRVLYMSGYTDNAIDRHGVLDPGATFISKPFTSAALAGKVREALSHPRGVRGTP